MDTPNSATLFAKLATVMGQCRTLEKSGENKFDHYSYVTADAIALRIGSLLAEVGIAFLPSIVGVETSEYTTAKGAANFRTVVNMQMTFACTDSGATYTSLWSGEAIDRSDKSISKAAVSATKYFLLKTFLVTGGDESEADAESPQVQTRKPAHRAPAHQDVEFGNNEAEAMWEPDTAPSTKKPDSVSQVQLSRLHLLGSQAYGDKWDAERERLVTAVSKGAISSSKELTRDEADILIRGIETKLKAAKASNGTPVAA